MTGGSGSGSGSGERALHTDDGERGDVLQIGFWFMPSCDSSARRRLAWAYYPLRVLRGPGSGGRALCHVVRLRPRISKAGDKCGQLIPSF